MRQPVTATSLRLQVMLLVLGALVPALLLLVHRGRVERQILDAQTRETALRIARVAAIEEERLAEGIRQLLVTAAEVVETQGSAYACNELFPLLLREQRRLANIGVIDRNGQLRCSGSGEGPANLADRDYFQGALESGDFAVGAYRLDTDRGDPTVGFGVPIRDERGRPVAVAFATLRLAWLAPLLERASLPEGATLAVLDQNGTLLARRPASPLEVGRFPTNAPLVAEIRSKREGTAVMEGSDGVERVYGFTWVPRGVEGSGLHVVVSLPLDAALGPVEAVARRDLLVLLAVALLGMGAAWFGGTLLVRPLRSLVRATSRLRRGDLGARVGEVRGPAEFRELATSFDAMAESLETTTGSLRSRAEELSALATAARAVVDDMSLEAVASVVVEQTQSALHADRSAVWSLEHDTFRLLAARGFRSDPRRMERLDRSCAPQLFAAAETGEIIHIPDARRLELRGDETATLARAEGVRSVLAVPLRFRGRAVGVLVVAHTAPGHFDEEERRLATALGDLFAAALQDARLFEQVRRGLWLRESFIAAAAHELRSPATALKTFALLLQRRLGTTADEAPVVEKLVRIADRTAALARDLVEAQELLGGATLDWSDVELVELVRRAAREVEAVGPDREVRIGGDEPVIVHADGTRLAQAVRGLLDLAFRYQPRGGVVLVRVEAAEDEVRVLVADQGPGIPPERVAHVFEPLFEPWPPGSPHYIGIVGLGPFLSRLVAEAHGGRLEIRSALGGGTTTTLHLPRI